jgi:predicted dehydrogenase
MPEIANYAEYVQQDLKFAVIGFGKMGILHSGILNLLRPNSVRAVVDKSRLLGFGASRLMRNIRFYRDLDKMLRIEQPDVVYVTTPAQSHYGIVSKLLETSVGSIFVEKPPTTNTKDLCSLIGRMDDNHMVMVGFQKRFALPFRHAKMLISERVIGDIEKVSAYTKSSDIMAPTVRFDSLGRGVLLDLGVHLLDLLLWMFNAKIVEASRYRRIHTGVDDYFEAKLSTEDGVQVDIEVTWSSAEHRLPETGLQVRASNGVLRVSEDHLKVELAERHRMLNDETKVSMYAPHYYQGIPPVNLASPEYTLENIHFLHCIHSGKEPLTSPRNVAGTMELVDEIYRKAEL